MTGLPKYCKQCKGAPASAPKHDRGRKTHHVSPSTQRLATLELASADASEFDDLSNISPDVLFADDMVAMGESHSSETNGFRRRVAHAASVDRTVAQHPPARSHNRLIMFQPRKHRLQKVMYRVY